MRIPEDDEVGDQVQVEAEAKGITVSRQGMIVMGIPVGTPAYVAQQVKRLLEKYTADLEALPTFDRQQQFSILALCINARPQFLVRALQPQQLEGILTAFDKAITKAPISITGDDCGSIEEKFWNCIHLLRGQEDWA